MTISIEIPKDATFIKHQMKLSCVNEWWCPNCGAHGNHETIDCVPDSSWRWEEDDFAWAEYCCGECFEPGIYVTFNNE